MCSLYTEPSARLLTKAAEVNSIQQKLSPSSTCKSLFFLHQQQQQQLAQRTPSPISVKSPLHPLDHSNKAINSHSPDLPVGKSTSPLASAKTHSLSSSPLQLNINEAK